MDCGKSIAIPAVVVLLTAACVMCNMGASWCLDANQESVTASPTTPRPHKNIVGQLRDLVASSIDSSWSAVSRRLVRAEVSPTCTAGLLKLAKGLRQLEPWAFRLIDASGKYPTGLLQATTSDPGSFDECVETVVHDPVSGRESLRAQYCNLRLRLVKDDGLIQELDALFRTGHPRVSDGAPKARHTPAIISGILQVRPHRTLK
ncbi:hypothetical protein HPB48_007571 [Haemaphysalis longicornis]|uniref:Nose resistant-to-fluoxetine protein N-terminal domain-containing protein n=1 Tax=Haemaphysalis longicornis TaxID=44386 RepID=A0A9J6FD95_HAELO|nr:hypothetical protein HPB48_007571 [Haemaphysalis longicornis]